MDGIRRTAVLARLSTGAILAAGAMFTPIAHGSVIFTSRDTLLTGIVCDSSGLDCAPQSIHDTSFNGLSTSAGTRDLHGYASEQSQLSQSGITVNLYSQQGHYYSEIGSARFFVSFTLDTATAFTLSGDSGYMLTAGSAQVTESWPCQNPPFLWFGCTNETNSAGAIRSSVSDSGVLDPGTYSLELDTYASGSFQRGTPNAAASATLSLQPVPLPPGAPLLGAGLSLFGLVRRRVG